MGEEREGVCLCCWGIDGLMDCVWCVCKVGDVEVQRSWANVSLDKSFVRWSPREKAVLCGACMAFDQFCWWIVPMVFDHPNTCTLSELSVLLLLQDGVLYGDFMALVVMSRSDLLAEKVLWWLMIEISSLS